eukprot:GCRY01000787.1.p1 GENE.GCRY01000787.1~~GCRY01000787.1.p1  ORF type:complete len:657 (-),score=74.41 GCRY01000787.1:34-2004(-)
MRFCSWVEIRWNRVCSSCFEVFGRRRSFRKSGVEQSFGSFIRREKTEPGNCRGIAVMSVVAKLFNRLLRRRVCGKVKISEEQAAFQAGRSTEDHLFVLQTVVEKRLAEKKKTWLCFVDLKKAYDRVWRNGLWWRLEKMGVDGKCGRLIRKSYEKVESAVMTESGLSRWFEVELGVRQGDVLSPVLFLVFMEELIERMRVKCVGVKVDAKVLGMLCFADDIVLMAECKEDLEEQLRVLQKWSDEWRMDVNEEKTKVMVVGGKAIDKEDEVKFGDGRIGFCEEYEYLGVKLNEEMSRKRIGESIVHKMEKAIAKRKGAMCLKELSMRSRVNFYKTYIRPVVEYGSGVWMMNEIVIRKLKTMRTNQLKEVMKAPLRTSNCVVLGDCGLEKLEMRRDLKKLTMYMKGRQKDGIVKSCLEEKYVFRGRKKSWPRKLDELIKKYGLEQEINASMRLKELKMKMKKCWIEEWWNDVKKMKNLRYMGLKERFGMEGWMKEKWNEGKRIKWMWRSGASQLSEEKWRSEGQGLEDEDWFEDENKNSREKRGCPVCGSVKEETVEHVLVECGEYEDLRQECGWAMQRILEGLDEEEWLVKLKMFRKEDVIKVLLGDMKVGRKGSRRVFNHLIEQFFEKIHYQRKAVLMNLSNTEQLSGAHGNTITMA